MIRTAALAASLAAFGAPALAATPAPLTAAQVNDAAFVPPPDKPAKVPSAEVAKAQVLLDRARFPSGPVDGMEGGNLAGALRAYQLQAVLPASGKLDQATWDRLTSGSPAPAVRSYTVTDDDAKGPFSPDIPAKFEAQSKLKHLGYHDVGEELAERFHMGREFLRGMNPGSKLSPGDAISVADVDRPGPPPRAARVIVDKKGLDVEALATDGALLARYPASVGSHDKPAPTGDFTIHYVAPNPTYKYNPKYHFKGVHASEPFLIRPGPNNPVGLVWMDLGGHGYGIHGTPDPTEVGKTQSHGCVRLANWDALDLASMVGRGTPVSFGDVPGSNGPVAPPPATPPVGTAPVAVTATSTPTSAPGTSPAVR